MKKHKIVTNISAYASQKELPNTERVLFESALKASAYAYAPYSGFRVGAAVLLEDGTIVTGNNQENAAYPSGLCAERVALFSASSNYPGMAVKAIAITAQGRNNLSKNPLTPCGACRQVMVEYEMLSKGSVKIIMDGNNGEVLVTDSVKSLLPLAFDANIMKGKKE